MPVELFNACIQPSGTITLKEDGTMDTDEEDEEPIECNYDTDLITLYQALEEKAWIPALDLIQKDTQDSRDQVRTWVTRYEANGNVRWSQLPIHAAMIFQAPYKIVKALVDAYPKGVRCTDDQHMLPLHLAFRYGVPDNTLLLLLETFPEAMNAKNRKGRVPALCACPTDPHRSKIVRYHIDNTKQVILEDRPDKKTVNRQLTEMEERMEVQSKKAEILEAEKEEWIAKEEELNAKIVELEEKLQAQEIAAESALAAQQEQAPPSTKKSKDDKSTKTSKSEKSSKSNKSQESETSKSTEQSAAVSAAEATEKSAAVTEKTNKTSSTKGSNGSTEKSSKSGKTSGSTKTGKSGKSGKSFGSSLSSKLLKVGRKKSKVPAQ